MQFIHVMKRVLYCFRTYGICISLTESPLEGVSQQDLVSRAEISPEKVEFADGKPSVTSSVYCQSTSWHNETFKC